MSGFVNPQDVKDRIAEVTPEDGELAYLVEQHWVRWVPFVLVAPALTVGTIALLVELALKGYLGITHWWTWAILAVVAWLLWHVDLLWYAHLRNRLLLLTPRTLYWQRMERLFYKPATITAADKIVGISTATTRWNWIGIDVRTVTINTEGDLPTVRYKYAAGGEHTERGLNTIFQKIPRP